MNKHTCARLISGEVVRLSKECDCLTHTGPHWQHVDQLWKESNRRLLELSPLGFAREESARLQELLHTFQTEGIAKLLTEEEGAPLVRRGGLRHHLRKSLLLSRNDAEKHLGGRALRSYLALWEWCGHRFSGRAGQKQEAFWEKYGKEAFYRRVNKVRAACGFEPLIEA